jgi:hypothetical protein
MFMFVAVLWSAAAQVVKALLGSIDPEFDSMDEGTKSCCTIL